MPRTKKTPTSQSLAARATKGPKETPKGSGPSVAPSLKARVAVPLVTIDADAVHRARALPVTEKDLAMHALPLVEAYWQLRRPGEPRVRPSHGHTPALEPILDAEREEVGRNWAVLSSWAPRPIFYAPEVQIDALHRRFPFARPRSVAGVLRLLTLHELAHHAHGHNGLSAGLNASSREELDRSFASMEAQADEMTETFWREGLSARTVRAAVPGAA
ncbi:MAG TPA: hypothetical protein PLL76_22090 [Thermoanaerobaculia bacterium]|nr:hypothetical protein [Thermoanaerobaculia bacterium]